MPLLILFITMPLLFFGGLCFLVGNAVPSLIGGGLCGALALLSGFAASSASENGTSGGIGIFLLVTLPFAGNALALLLGGGIYYLAKAVG